MDYFQDEADMPSEVSDTPAFPISRFDRQYEPKADRLSGIAQRTSLRLRSSPAYAPTIDLSHPV